MGIDLGTQSLKVLVYSPNEKRVVAQAQSPLELNTGSDGRREQNAAWWIEALQAGCRALDPAIRAGISTLGVAGQQHGFVAVGVDGSVVAPVKLWNDTSTLAECALIEERLGGPELAVALAGNQLLPGYTASKVVWLKRHMPVAYEQLRHILLPHDYINFYLTGLYATECGDASGTGFFDVRRRQWCEPILRAMDPERDLRAFLPPLLAPTQAVGTLRPQAAAALGLATDVIVAAGGGDNMMGAIGTGAVVPGVLTLSLGTSGTLYGYSDVPKIALRQEFAAFCASTGGYLPLVCTMNCTAATELMRDLMLVPAADFEALLAAAAPGADGVSAVPFFNGERTPNCPHGRAAFFGLSATNASRANLLRAVVEATVYGLRSGLMAMEATGLAATEVRVIGGGSHSAAWRQIVANVLNLDVLVPVHEETAAFGAALQALWCRHAFAGDDGGIAAIVGDHVAFAAAKGCRPQPAARAAYAQQYAAYLTHAQLVQDLYARPVLA